MTNQFLYSAGKSVNMHVGYAAGINKVACNDWGSIPT